MFRYPQWVDQRLLGPNSTGRLFNANACGRAASLACGSFTSVELSINDKNILCEARFSSNGCGYMIAAADEILDHLNGSGIIETGGFEAAFNSRGNKLPAERRQCVEVVSEAIRAAFADRRQQILDEFTGDDALICTCFGIGEGRVREAIRSQSLESVDHIAAATNAGSGCGSCRMLLQEILDSR